MDIKFKKNGNIDVWIVICLGLCCRWGAGIGYATNWLAIKMLFHPRKPRFGLQGLLPRRQGEIADSVGRIVATELLSVDSLLDKLDEVDLGPSFEKLAQGALESKVEDLQKFRSSAALSPPTVWAPLARRWWMNSKKRSRRSSTS